MNPLSDKTTNRTADRRWWGCMGALLALQAFLGLHAASRLTVTHDEYWHLPVGLLAWKTGRFDYDSINPPLTRMWSSLPLVMTGAKTGPTDRPLGPGHGDEFLKANRDQYRQWFLLGRGMSVLLSVLTGVVLAIWSRELFGRAAGCLTVLLWCTCPTILANAALVTPDIGVTFFYVATLFSLWRFARRPTWRGAIVTGLLLGLAQTAKFTAVLLYPLCVVLWIVAQRTSSIHPKNGEGEEKTKPGFFGKAGLLKAGAVLLLVSLTSWNTVYLFRGTCSSLGSYEFGSRALAHFNQAPAWIKALPVPLPRDYVMGLDRQRQIMEAEHPVYLDREWSTQGFPEYYVMALLYKLPHVLQALLVLTTLFLLFPRGEQRQGWTQCYILLPFALLMIAASAGGMQLGVRYILPVFPFLMLFAGQAARWTVEARLFRKAGLLNPRAVAVLVLAVLAPLSLRYHPHHLAYFNELSGGPDHGRDHLLDSNLDWGQALGDLAAELKRRDIQEVGLAYFGTVPPETEGIRYHLPPSDNPQPGWYAVSVNFVMGRPHVLRDPQGNVKGLRLGEYGYFSAFEPVVTIGHAIDLYHITEPDVLRWRAAMSR